MNPITHLLVSWPLAAARPGLSTREQGWVVAAGLVPDVDGVGIVAELLTRGGEEPLLWWSEYHHRLAHNLFFGLLFAGLVLAMTRRFAAAALGLVAFHLHLLGDLVGSRGPDGAQWPIDYLFPLSSTELTVPWQWALDAWPNVALSVALLAFALWFTWRHGRSPLGLVWARGDAALVAALRRRFPRWDGGTRESGSPAAD